MTPKEKLISLGFELPPSPKAIASYIPANRSGNLIFTSGQLPLKDGKLLFTGKLGKDVSMESAKKCSETACLNGIAAIASLIGDINQISRIIKIGVYVASTPEFIEHHIVANFASDLLVNIWGEKGKHARFAIGVSSLPLNAPVEIELVIETG